MGDSGIWCLIESDPGVFTEMLRGFGVSGVQVEELYTLEEEEFANLRPILGLVFLFKWRPGDEPIGQPVENDDNIFFAQQVISNACATQALINMLLNVDDPTVELGEILSEYRDFAKDIDPANRGLVLSNSDKIRTVHNSFARQTLFELDLKGQKEDDNYHFITYVPLGGKVYELDGLREYPLEVGTVREGQDWLQAVKPVIQARIEKYNEGEIHFNLMAVIADRKAKYLKRMNEISEAGMDTPEVAQELCGLQMAIDEEDSKMKRYRVENVRRRHNYLPFIIELLKILAKEGKLVPLVEQAQEKAKARHAEREKLKSKA